MNSYYWIVLLMEKMLYLYEYATKPRKCLNDVHKDHLMLCHLIECIRLLIVTMSLSRTVSETLDPLLVYEFRAYVTANDLQQFISWSTTDERT